MISRGKIAAAVVSAVLVGGCGELSRILEDRLGGAQGGDAGVPTAVGIPGDGDAASVGGGAMSAMNEEVLLPAALDGDGCNTQLTPTVGLSTPTAFAAVGPWQLCGTYGVGGAAIVKTSADGTRMALLTDSGQVWVLDARSFRLLGVFAHGDGPISFAGLSPDGRTLATVDAPVGRVALWDIETHALLRTLFRPAAAASYYSLGDVAFSHDGKRVAVVSSEHVDVFDTETATALAISTRTDGGGAMRAAFAAGDTRLVLARFKYWGNGPYAGWGGVDVVDATTGDNLTHLDKTLAIELPAIAVSGDGETLAVGATNAGVWPITLFNARTGQRIAEQASLGVPLGLDHAGMRLAMIDPPPPSDPTGATSSSALTVTVRRIRDGALLRTVTVDQSAPSSRPKLLTVTPDLETLLVGANATHVLTRFNVASGRRAAVACGPGHASDVATLAISSDDRLLVSTGDSTDATALQWDVATGAPAKGPLPGNPRQASAVSRDGKLRADPSASGPPFFDLRDAASGAIVRRVGPQPTRPTTFDFTADGSLIASASERDPVDRQQGPVTHVWSVDGGELQQTLPVVTSQPETNAQPVLFGNDGHHLFVGGFTSTAVWCRSP